MMPDISGLTEGQQMIFKKMKEKADKECLEMAEAFFGKYRDIKEPKPCAFDCIAAQGVAISSAISHYGSLFMEHGLEPFDELDKYLDFLKEINRVSRHADARFKAFAKGMSNE